MITITNLSNKNLKGLQLRTLVSKRDSVVSEKDTVVSSGNNGVKLLHLIAGWFAIRGSNGPWAYNPPWEHGLKGGKSNE